MTKPSRSFQAAFGVLSALVVWLLWSNRYPPMADLPQHVAQLSLFMHYRDPSLHLSDTYFLNWTAPYLAANLLGRALAVVLPPLVSLKVLITLALLATPLATLRLIRRTEGDPWLALLVFPTLFGYAFSWGLLNFLLALPLALLFLVATHWYLDSPSPARAATLGIFAILLYPAHALALGFAGAAAATIVAGRSASFAIAARRMWPLLAPLPPLVLWLRFTVAHNADAREPIVWWTDYYNRAHFLVHGMLSQPGDSWAALCTIALLVIALAAGRPRVRLDAQGPFAVALAACLFMPEKAVGTASVFERFIVFLMPAFVASLGVRSDSPSRRAAHLAAFAVSAAWLLHWTAPFARFDRDARDLEALAPHVRPGASVMSVPFELDSPGIPGVPFLHFAAYLQAQNYGPIGYSFAANNPAFVRYRPGHERPMSEGLAFSASRYHPDPDGDRDYFLVRAANPPAADFFGLAPDAVVLEAHQGKWWLYRHGRRQ